MKPTSFSHREPKTTTGRWQKNTSHLSGVFFIFVQGQHFFNWPDLRLIHIFQVWTTYKYTRHTHIRTELSVQVKTTDLSDGWISLSCFSFRALVRHMVAQCGGLLKHGDMWWDVAIKIFTNTCNYSNLHIYFTNTLIFFSDNFFNLLFSL